MHKGKQDELRRLEEALMEAGTFPEQPEDELDILENTWQATSDVHCHVYNTDDADVDLQAYSEDVHRGRQSNPLPVCITILALCALAAMIFGLFKYMGVIG